MLTAEQRQTFDLRGLVKLPAAIPATDSGRMGDAVWSFLAEHRGIQRHDRTTWGVDRPTGFQPLTRSGGLDGIWSAPVADAVAALLGPADRQRRERGRLLITFPQATAWTVPGDSWHFDYVPPDGTDPRAVQVFALLDDVRPHGGGTLVLTGSHRLVAAVGRSQEPRPRAVRAALATAHPWLADLWAPDEQSTPAEREDSFLKHPEPIHDVTVEVVEVTGRAGDVFLMHSDCFHAIAPNALDRPRLMCTSLVTRRP
ncbi:phytanoyl-CoA dioxygenase family protein [Microlunatus soli]|uniref:Phytanoyl-CoA dioxygenase (PhyH) n=1 Tax=Microlunatus soli TaxID=630515 RepID=A0A1H1MYJ9_9ACTN|nr:phytanoyl-CoA dioxygenase family protein [Microlunatus soli]SDR91707.1 Phytanoyl-CoA dioxygenase (PhyH) [Microlunatus soli]